jgi:hypothetical protein
MVIWVDTYQGLAGCHGLNALSILNEPEGRILKRLELFARAILSVENLTLH